MSYRFYLQPKPETVEMKVELFLGGAIQDGQEQQISLVFNGVPLIEVTADGSVTVRTLEKKVTIGSIQIVKKSPVISLSTLRI